MLVKNDTNKEIINNLENCNIEIFADNDRAEQVFVNLIENAIKYSKEDSPIELDYEITENKLVVRGTGLGLFIVKGLVEAMNGEIRLYSNKECGFCVKVFLPIAKNLQNMVK